MFEYGNGVGEVAGRAGGGSGAGTTVDVGASIGHFITDSAHTIGAMPPAMILAGIVVIVLGLMAVKRAF